RHGVEGNHRPKSLEVNRHIALTHERNDDRDGKTSRWRPTGRLSLRFGSRIKADAGEGGDGHRYACYNPPLPCHRCTSKDGLFFTRFSTGPRCSVENDRLSTHSQC